jgi:hypothetical protein
VGTIREWLAERQVAVIVVSFARPASLRTYRDQKAWPFPLLADPDRTLYREFQLDRLPWSRLVRPRVVWIYLKLMWANRGLDRYQGEDVFQAGGDVLLGPQGEILHAHRSHDPADRPTVEEVLQIVERSR